MKRVLGVLILMSSLSAMAQVGKTSILCDNVLRAVVTSATVTDLGNNKVAFSYYHIGGYSAPAYEFDLVGYKVNNPSVILNINDVTDYSDQYVLFDKEGKKTEVKVKSFLDLPAQCPEHSRAPCFNNGPSKQGYILEVSNDEINFTKTCMEKSFPF